MRLLLRYGVLCCLFLSTRAMAQFAALPVDAIIFSTDGSTPVADSNQIFTVHDILITGNEQTKVSTIWRELPFEKGQQYRLDAIVEQFNEAKRHLMNTGLFRNVVVSLQSVQGREVNINVVVEERWYIYPMPFLKPIDNSFFTWATEKDRDPERLNYGLKVTHKNFTGRNDRLYVYFMNGYTKQVQLQYMGLYLDRNMQWYAGVNVQYGKNREVNYATIDNKVMPLKADHDYVHSFFRSYLDVTYRKAIKTRHTFGVGYESERVVDSVYKLNPGFSPGAQSTQYPLVYYKLSYANLDFNAYPTQGNITEVGLSKKGINSPINIWQLSARTSSFWPLNEKYFLNLRMTGTVKLPFKQPYIAQQFIGYNGMFMQGYEGYVIDGVAGGYAKLSINRPVFSTRLKIPTQKLSNRLSRFNTIPLKVYAKAFVNAGYIYNANEVSGSLNNRMLCSGGLGLDIVASNDFVIKFEWSLNQLGQNGLYLHPRDNY